VRLDEFVEMVERNRPDTLEASVVHGVKPNPWVLRAGHGTEARIRMQVGNVRYERQPGSTIWYRSDVRSDLDVLDAA
jgi:hypothetical protein